jgi:trk system potassium uptake protein TrkH
MPGGPIRLHKPARLSAPNITLIFFSALAVISLALEHGFYTPPVPRWLLLGVQASAVLAFVLLKFVEFFQSQKWITFARDHWLDFGLMGLGFLVLLLEWDTTRQPILKMGTIYVFTMQGLLLLRFGLGVLRFQLAFARSGLPSARLMLVSFAALIVIGASLLMLPKSTLPTIGGEGHFFYKHALNCLFTSTSAACVTGLIVYDTGRDFTLFGQAVILSLIQLGGLGIMIFGSILGLLVGRQLSLRESLMLQDTLQQETFGQIRSLVQFIIISTLVIEATGAAVLWTMFNTEPEGDRRLFLAVFHAVSAFCNAGFALQSDSLVSHRSAWQVYFGIVPLILMGGLGFPVLHNLWLVGIQQFRKRMSHRPRTVRAPRWSLHSKLVLSTTAMLLVFGAVLLFFFETPSPLRGQSRLLLGFQPSTDVSEDLISGMSIGDRFLAAWFQSVTTRTAGFNTIPLGTEDVSPASHFLLAVLMFIGGSPGSTAGGVKTISIAVLCLAIVATLRRRDKVEIFHRTIPEQIVRRASVLIFVMFGLVTTVTLSLSFTEHASLDETLFESVSACGTVGLSTGLTPRLTIAGRCIIILAMLAGRLGPLTLLIALVGNLRSAKYEYPRDNVVIG